MVNPLRRNFLILAVALVAILGVAAVFRNRMSQPSAQAPAPAGRSRPVARLILKIDGMDCLMCAAGLQNTLREIPGVKRAEVSFQDKQAVLDYDPAMVDPSHFTKIIADSGFKVVPQDSAVH
ncbi:MAG: heavy-metal-associated domain-containing protein [Terriglobia bacterium]